MAGAPVCAPANADAASNSVPSAVPRTTAANAATRESGATPFGARTKSAPTGPSRLTPRFPHNASWSTTLSGRGTGPARVRAGSTQRSLGRAITVSAVAAIAPSLRRHYPVRFGGRRPIRRPLSPARSELPRAVDRIAGRPLTGKSVVRRRRSSHETTRALDRLRWRTGRNRSRSRCGRRCRDVAVAWGLPPAQLRRSEGCPCGPELVTVPRASLAFAGVTVTRP